MSPTLILFLAAVQILTLIAVVALLLRARSAAPAWQPDPRLTQLPDALAEHGVRHGTQLQGVDASLQNGLRELRASFNELRNDTADRVLATSTAQDEASRQLRAEVSQSIAQLGDTLHAGLTGFRTDNRTSDETLRTAVQADLLAISQRLGNFIADANRHQIESRDALHTRLTDLGNASTAHQEKLRSTVGESLAKLNTDNTAKLEEMRATVDEKLHATLHTRLTESFGQVTDQLNKVHTGLGEMSKLSEGVDGLSRIFTNVKSRGGFAEVQLGMLLKQMLAPGQYLENAIVKPGSAERVEYAIRFPTNAGERLMPIDAKFPREAWERLESAYESNLPDAIQREGRSFENAIRTEAERICGKYINTPVTTPYAIMFLPTEGLYAEVIRREALQAEIQSKCHVTIAGPTTLSAILTSFQMGFHMLALQEKGDEVWKVLESAKTEFGKFGKLMDKVEGDVGKIQKTLGEVGVRTRAINRSLREVSDASTSAPLEFEDFAGVAPLLAATADEEKD